MRPPPLVEGPISPLVKLIQALRILRLFIHARVGLLRHPLPVYLQRAKSIRPAKRSLPPRRLGRIVGQVLSVGPLDPRCIFRAVVLYRLLHAQGDRPELVIGLPLGARDNKAHAWVELEGVDVGPPPGKAGHQVLARYG